jgi:hypothetical protein
MKKNVIELLKQKEAGLSEVYKLMDSTKKKSTLDALDKDEIEFKSQISVLRYLLSLPDKGVKLPTIAIMDEQILEIMDDNLSVGTVEENTEGIICNRFATSLKIVDYIKKLVKQKRKLK